jgi:hypothetical protein
VSAQDVEDVSCACSDCLAHREPSDYGDVAKLHAKLDLLREALHAAAHSVWSSECLAWVEYDDGRQEPTTVFNDKTEAIVRKALAVWPDFS